jgi:hypothetical protein
LEKLTLVAFQQSKSGTKQNGRTVGFSIFKFGGTAKSRWAMANSKWIRGAEAQNLMDWKISQNSQIPGMDLLREIVDTTHRATMFQDIRLFQNLYSPCLPLVFKPNRQTYSKPFRSDGFQQPKSYAGPR